MLPETIISPYMYEKATYNSLETQTLLLKGEDLSQLLQSLIDRIKALEAKPPHVEVTEPHETVIV